jgi:hypothetical protein
VSLLFPLFGVAGVPLMIGVLLWMAVVDTSYAGTIIAFLDEEPIHGAII